MDSQDIRVASLKMILSQLANANEVLCMQEQAPLIPTEDELIIRAQRLEKYIMWGS